MERKLGDRSQALLNEVYEEGYDPAAPKKKAAASKPKEPKTEKVQLEDLDMEHQAELLIRWLWVFWSDTDPVWISQFRSKVYNQIRKMFPFFID